MFGLVIILFLLLMPESSVGQACKDSYAQGFYDPCLDSDCNFECPDASKRITVADPDDCKKYFLCQAGSLVPQECPAGDLFNMNYHRCVRQKDGYDKCQFVCADTNMRYKDFIRYPTTDVPSKSDPCQETYNTGFYDPCYSVNCGFKCPDKTKTITVADPEECSSYFECLNDGLYRLTCPFGYKFNMNLHRCSPSIPGYDKCQGTCFGNNTDYKNFIRNIPTSGKSSTATPSSSLSSSSSTTPSSSSSTTTPSSSSSKPSVEDQSLTTEGKNVDLPISVEINITNKSIQEATTMIPASDITSTLSQDEHSTKGLSDNIADNPGSTTLSPCPMSHSNSKDDECTRYQYLKIFKELKSILKFEEFMTHPPEGIYPNMTGPGSSLVPALALNLSNLSRAGDLNPDILNITINSLKLFIDIRNMTGSRPVDQNEIMSVLNVISNVLDGNNMESWSVLREFDDDIATAITRTVDFYLVKINTSLQESLKKFTNLVVQTKTIGDDDVININLPQPTFPAYDGREPKFDKFDNISLSTEFVKASYVGISPPTTVYTVVYFNLDKYLPVQKNKSFLASKIMMIETSNPVRGRVEGGINITFAHTITNISANFSPSCVFWNYSLGRNGAWSSDGCRVLWTNENATTCSCDHMTNFAILMSIDHELLVDDLAITLISMIGCIISIVCLVLTIILLVASWRRAKMFNHFVTLVNLCVALIIANIVFTAGIDKTQPRELCIAIATMLHFFYLSGFFLMLAEGVQLLVYVIVVFPVERKLAIITIIAAWVLSFVVVGVSLIATGTVGYGTSKHCWLSTSNGLMWAFIGPALFIILVNICILFIVLYKARRRKIVPEKLNLKSHIKRSLWNVLVISPLLGVTWVFGVLAVSQSLVAFQYVFVIVNSLQGLFIFIFHGFYNHLRLRKDTTYSKWKFGNNNNKDKQCYDERNKEPNQGIQNGCYVAFDTPRGSVTDELRMPVEMCRYKKDGVLNSSYGSQSTESISVGSSAET